MVHDAKDKVFQLPLSVVSTIDVLRLNHEIETVDNFLVQAAMRKGGEKVIMPRLSKMLEEVATQNNSNLLHEAERAQIKTILAKLKADAPVIHISFATEPGQKFLERLMTWLRGEIHPSVLLQIGLQPSIAAGCVVRTTNKYFDFSVRQYFTDNRPQLISQLEGKK
jgi:F0F1-type ATP synthase delta subunit